MSEQASYNDVALLFSGGLDSTLAATVLAQNYDRVHLVSVSRGYGHTKVGRTSRRFEELRARLDPNKFDHVILSAKDLFRRAILRTLVHDVVKYKGLFVICVGCKLVMHTIGAIYCLERGIPNIADGASGATGWMSDQTEEALQGYRQLHAALGLRYSNPVVQITNRQDERDRLKELGFSTGRKVAGRDLGTQPVCLYGDLLTFLREAIFKVSLPVSDKAIGSYLAEKMPLLWEHVRGHFQPGGKDASEKDDHVSE